MMDDMVKVTSMNTYNYTYKQSKLKEINRQRYLKV